MKTGVITLFSILVIIVLFNYLQQQAPFISNSDNSIDSSTKTKLDTNVKASNNSAIQVDTLRASVSKIGAISTVNQQGTNEECQSYNSSNQCTQYALNPKLSVDISSNAYCLKQNDQNQCTTFTLETNFKKYFYDEKLHATKAMPMLALLSSNNFHEVMLNMDSISTDSQISSIKANLNQTLERIKQQGLAINAQQVECGDYLCAVDFGEISDEASDLATKLLYDSDSRLDSTFTNSQRIIFSFNSDVIFRPSNDKHL